MLSIFPLYFPIKVFSSNSNCICETIWFSCNALPFVDKLCSNLFRLKIVSKLRWLKMHVKWEPENGIAGDNFGIAIHLIWSSTLVQDYYHLSTNRNPSLKQAGKNHKFIFQMLQPKTHISYYISLACQHTIKDILNILTSTNGDCLNTWIICTATLCEIDECGSLHARHTNWLLST